MGEEYKENEKSSMEEPSFKLACSAVEKQYKKDKSGKWVKK
jgi:cation transport regulator ChaB